MCAHCQAVCGVDMFSLVLAGRWVCTANASACKFHIMFFYGMVNYMVVVPSTVCACVRHAHVFGVIKLEEKQM